MFESELHVTKPHGEHASAPLLRKLFLVLAAGVAVMGLCLAFSVPIFQIPDENAHWIQGHARVERALGNAGDCVPTVSLDEWFQLEPMRSHPERKMIRGQYERLRDVPNPCVKAWDEYGDILTYPGIIGSKILVPGQVQSSFRQVQGIVVARLLQGLLLVLCLLRLAWLARESRPTGLVTVGAFALSPLFAQQSFGVSSDGVGLYFGLSMVAVTLFWGQLRRLDLAIFSLFGWAACAKPFVLPCVLGSVVMGWWYERLRTGHSGGLGQAIRAFLRAWLPTRRPSTETLFLWVAALLTLTAVALALLNAATIKVGKVGVDGAAQLLHLRRNPAVLWDLFWGVTPRWWVLSDWAGQLGWLDVKLSESALALFRNLFLFAVAIELVSLSFDVVSHGPTVTARARIAAMAVAAMGLGVTLVTWVLVIVVLYLRWTPVGSSFVHGFQIRYLFPSAVWALAVIVGGFEIAIGGRAVGTTSGAPPPRIGLRARRAFAVVVTWSVIVVASSLVLQLVSNVFLDVLARYV